jgi:hypothetical protein
MKNLYLQNWLGGYFRDLASRLVRKSANGPTHVIFQFVDHFELAGKQPRLSEWMSKYPEIASRHRDADGSFPKHTWFYALDLMQEEELARLSELVQAGFGEVEFHWHHSHDSAESFREKLHAGLKVFQKYGFMKPVGPGKAGCFGFIHGNWSLNNSRGDEFCGVPNEIEILKQAGCYGDFTFPAMHCAAQPNMVNSLYYAGFAEGRAGYSRGRRAAVGRTEGEREFLIFQGPYTINWRDWRFRWHPCLEDGEVGMRCSHGEPVRIDSWVRQGIQVQGRPEWVFVKVFCHGGQDHRHVLGEATERMFSYLEQRYNDGDNYHLHYVTSRESYNMVKAAEDGHSGDPGRFRDYMIPHPLAR